jgi:hypothetical protein
MSSVAFTTPTREVLVRGPERAHAGILTNHIMLAVLGIGGSLHPSDHWILKYVPEGTWARRDPRFIDTYLTGFEPILEVPGHGRVHGMDLALNTAIVLGGDPLRLLAHMHGTCEVHGYILGHDRGWLAGIIDEGVASGVLRQSMSHYTGGTREDSGWLALAEMLRERDDEPVVTSYSVCEGFPNPGVALVPPDDVEAWYDLPDDVRWDQAWTNLQKIPWLRWDPEGFPNPGFASGLTAFELERIDVEARSSDPVT